MAVRGINLTQVHVFKWKEDPDFGTPQESRLKLKNLDGRLVAYINDLLVDSVATDGSSMMSMKMGTAAYAGVQLALVEIENILDADGVPLVMRKAQKNINGVTYPVVHDELMAQLPPELVQAAYQFLQDVNGLTKDDAKKSATL